MWFYTERIANRVSRLLRLLVAVKLFMPSRAWQYAVAYIVVMLGYLFVSWLNLEGMNP